MPEAEILAVGDEQPVFNPQVQFVDDVLRGPDDVAQQRRGERLLEQRGDGQQPIGLRTEIPAPGDDSLAQGGREALCQPLLAGGQPVGHEQRMALGGRKDRLAQRCQVVGGKLAQVDPQVDRQAAQHVGLHRATVGGEQDRDRRRGAAPAQIAQGGDGLGVSPVRVVQDHHEGAVVLDDLRQGLHHPHPGELVERLRHVGPAQQLGDDRHRSVGSLLQHRTQGQRQCDVRQLGLEVRAPVGPHLHTHSLGECLGQRGLADAGVADDQHDREVAVQGVRHGLLEPAELGGAPQQPGRGSRRHDPDRTGWRAGPGHQRRNVFVPQDRQVQGDRLVHRVDAELVGEQGAAPVERPERLLLPPERIGGRHQHLVGGLGERVERHCPLGKGQRRSRFTGDQRQPAGIDEDLHLLLGVGVAQLVGPSRVGLVLEHRAADERKRGIEPVQRLHRLQVRSGPDELVELLDVHGRLLGVEPVAAGLGDDHRVAGPATGLERLAHHRDVGLQRRRVVLRQGVGPEQLGQARLGHGVPAFGDQDLEQLLGLDAGEVPGRDDPAVH